MVGAVGDDEPGERALAALTDLDVDVSPVARRDDLGTGIAVITVDAERYWDLVLAALDRLGTT